MTRPKFFRDPIHVQLRFDDVDLSASCPTDSFSAKYSWLARKIIDTPSFQRLRFVRQNGLANLVFHGAEHTRFTHSLGVSHLAQRMYDHIIRNANLPEDEGTKLSAVIAALIHDVGHGPFSHTMEEILDLPGVQFHHERMTLRFVLEPDSEVSRLLSEVDQTLPGKIAAFFDKKVRLNNHWSYKIVSSQLDADRLDYLQRDALFAGLRGHGFDIERILDLLSHHDEQGIAVERGAIEAVEAYLVTLDLLYRAVYYHHTVRAATTMLSSLFRRAVDLHRNGDRSVFLFASFGDKFAELVDKGERMELPKYARLTEFHAWALVDHWREHKDGVLSTLSSMLLRRELFKTIPVDPQQFRDTQQREETAKEYVRRYYADLSGDVAQYFVIYDDPARTSYKRYDWSAESAEESIWLLGSGKPARPLEDDEESTIVQAFRSRRYFPRLIVPARVRDELLRS